MIKNLPGSAAIVKVISSITCSLVVVLIVLLTKPEFGT